MGPLGTMPIRVEDWVSRGNLPKKRGKLQSMPIVPIGTNSILQRLPHRTCVQRRKERCRCQHPNTFVKFLWALPSVIITFGCFKNGRFRSRQIGMPKVLAHHKEQPNFGISEKYLLDAIASTVDFLS
jgi:hypothetical protein